MTDSEFLTWIRDRIINVYGESPNVDFVLRLGEIIEAPSEKQRIVDMINSMPAPEHPAGPLYNAGYVAGLIQLRHMLQKEIGRV